MVTQQQIDNQRELRRIRRAQGQCVDCGQPAQGSYCAKCRGAERLRGQRKYSRRAERGLCGKCGKRPVRRFRTCSECRLRLQQWRFLLFSKFTK